MRSRACFTSKIAAVAIVLGTVQLAGQDNKPGPTAAWQPPASITSYRPLEDAAGLLEARFARPVTYEEPVWILSEGLAPKRKTLILPNVPGMTAAKRLDRSLVEAVTTAYVSQHSAPVFRVESSSYGLHVIPSASRDAAGIIRAQPALLDTVISIPPQTFLNAERALNEICKAVSAATGVWIDPSVRPINFGFSRLFDAGRPSAFSWKVDSQPARAAIISLLERSATTFTWRFLCQPSDKPEGRFCVLGVVPLELTVRDRSGRVVKRMLEYDRRPYSGPGPQPPPPPQD